MRKIVTLAGMFALPVLVGIFSASAQAGDLSYTIELSDVGTAIDGAVFEGITGGEDVGGLGPFILGQDASGTSVSDAGDVNGDGIADFLIAAPRVDIAGSNSLNRHGQVYLVYGEAGGSSLSGTIDLSDVGTTIAGAVLSGVDVTDEAGRVVSSAGDVNGDGVGDLLIGSSIGSYLIYGDSSTPLSGTIDLADVGSTVGGAFFDGLGQGAVSNAGDINGDGVGDLLIGEVLNNKAHLIYGQTGPAALSGTITEADLGVSVDGVTFNGAASGNRTGWSVSAAGDIDGNGIDDLVVSAPWADPDGKFNAGSVYLVYGQDGAGALSGALELSDIGGSVSGAVFNGITGGIDGPFNQPGDQVGNSLANVGDVNADGLDDFLIGAPRVFGATGASYLIFGQDGLDVLSGTFDLADLGTTLEGIAFAGLGGGGNNQFGEWVSGAGDVNGDGVADLLIGAPGASGVGQAYLILGSSSLTSGMFSIGSFSERVTFNGIAGDDRSGFSVSGAGDVNSDGFDDILIGAPGADPGGKLEAGKSFLVFGGAVVPEPATIVLASLGLMSLAGVRKRRGKVPGNKPVR